MVTDELSKDQNILSVDNNAMMIEIKDQGLKVNTYVMLPLLMTVLYKK